MRRAPAVVAATVALAAVAAPAWAYFTVRSAPATASVAAAQLGTPAVSLSGTPTATSVTLSVAAPSSGLAPAGYRVDRTAPTAATGVCSLAAPGPCTDAAPASGQTNTYAVYALRAGWASYVPATIDVAVPAETRSYALMPSTTTPVAGTAFTVTVTARNGAATDTTYFGTKTVTWSGGATIGSFAPVFPATVTFANGVGQASVTLYKAAAQTLVATDAAVPAFTGSTTVVPAPASVALSLACPSSGARGAAVSVTLARPATDAYGNSVTGQAVTATVSATFATPASQAVTVAAGTTSQGFSLTLSNSTRASVVTTDAPAGYTAAPSCSIAHT